MYSSHLKSGDYASLPWGWIIYLSCLKNFFFNIFWPHCVACGILVPLPAIEFSALQGRLLALGPPRKSWIFLNKCLSFIYFLQKLFLIYIFLAALGLCWFAQLSLVAATGATLRSGVRASLCSGFSCWGAEIHSGWIHFSSWNTLRLSICGAQV